MSDHPIRLVVTDDLKRTRITVGLRVLLAIPHYIWLFLWSLLAFLAALTNWVLTLLLGRSPGWLHRFLAAYVKYVTQLYAYIRVAANPYPSFDGPDGYPVDLRIAPPARQSRLSVLFRLPLALPAILIDQLLGGGYSVAFGRKGSLSGVSVNGLGFVVSVAAWFAGVAQRSMPRGLRDTAVWSVGYGAQLWSYLLLLTDRYPDSDPLALLPDVPAREDPIAVRCEDDLRRSRLTVLFRFPLSFPHLVWALLWTALALPAAFLNWLATLLTGTPPAVLHRFLSRYLRYVISVYAFLYVIANPFPGFGGAAGAYPPLETEIAPPARQSRWKVAFRWLLVIPAWVLASAYGSLLVLLAVLCWFSSLIRGRTPRGLRTAGTVALRYEAATFGYLMTLTDSYPYTGPLQGDAPRTPRSSPGA
ncbi:MAG: DUF4389 domain-containing protein [Solirubrobacteraceae bacterium]